MTREEQSIQGAAAVVERCVKGVESEEGIERNLGQVIVDQATGPAEREVLETELSKKGTDSKIKAAAKAIWGLLKKVGRGIKSAVIGVVKAIGKVFKAIGKAILGTMKFFGRRLMDLGAIMLDSTIEVSKIAGNTIAAAGMGYMAAYTGMALVPGRALGLTNSQTDKIVGRMAVGHAKGAVKATGRLAKSAVGFGEYSKKLRVSRSPEARKVREGKQTSATARERARQGQVRSRWGRAE